MLGLDAWNGSVSELTGFRNASGVTFPLLLNASSYSSSYDRLVVVGPDGKERWSGGTISSAISTAEAKVNELLAPPPSLVPAISVQQTALDFGTIEAGQTVEKTITVTNTGTASLEITGIASNVSGLTFDTKTFTLAPGGSQTVTVTFPSSMAGTFSGNITISSNDPDHSTQTVSISVIVQSPSPPPPPLPPPPPPPPPPPLPSLVPAISVQQTALDFGTIEAGQTVEKTITVTNTGTAPLEITGIASNVSGLTFDTVMFTLEPNGSRTVTITFPKPMEGTFSGNITISSNDPERATQTLSVSVIVQAAPAPVLVVGEPAIDFGTIDAEKTAQQTFTITNTGTALLEITGIESDVSGLTFEPSMFTLEPEGSQTVTITFPKPMEGEFSGNITISSNDPERARFMLTISGVVQPLSEEAKSDFDGDGVVGIADFLILVEAFGSTNSNYDIDGDGVVGITDFLIFVEAFGKTVGG